MKEYSTDVKANNEKEAIEIVRNKISDAIDITATFRFKDIYRVSFKSNKHLD